MKPTEKKLVSLLLQWIAEFATLASPTAVFLVIYTTNHSASHNTTLQHLSLVIPIILTLVLSRVLFSPRGRTPLHNMFFSAIYSLWIIAASCFYAAVLVGLNSWGMIPTWQLIAAYLPHWKDLLQTLGLSPLATAWIALTFATIVIGGSAAWIRHSTWAGRIGATIPKRLLWLALIATLLVSAYRVYEAKEGLNVGSSEPVMLAPQVRQLAPEIRPTAGVLRRENNGLSTKFDSLALCHAMVFWALFRAP